MLSGFAHIFAPRHDVVTSEMVRVCRPGGVVACTVWAHEEFVLRAPGPYRATRDVLQAKGVWEQAWAEVREVDRRANTATDGTYAMDQEYLVAVGRRP